MAFYSFMSIVCSSADGARSLAEKFPIDPIQVGDKTVTFSSGSDGKECKIFPDCKDMGWIACDGPDEPDEFKEDQAIADALYERLRMSEPFEAAIYGVEVGGWLELDHVRQILSDRSGIPGLVLGRLWSSTVVLGSKFIHFREDHVWVPYIPWRMW